MFHFTFFFLPPLIIFLKMQSAAILALQTISSISTSSIKTTSFIYRANAYQFSHQKYCRTNIQPCKASGYSQYSPITEFNLYELLGVEDFSDRSQIKEAYRALQKRCHPDIAGPAGHDMAIVLNEAYALLSDPLSRMAYDKELSKVSDFRGFTGKPMYSAWFGPESEERAVFVDEVKCVGCLKCALFAEKTFAVESVYGRARVVAQWADPEHKIQEAIGACPVDCIAMVERSNLAALEFIMSKQPRGKVRIGIGNTVGERVSDIFDELEKFQARYAKRTASANQSKESQDHRASRFSAIQAIQFISNWLYWQSPTSPNTTTTAPLATLKLPSGTRKHAEPSFKKLKEAATARKQGKTTTQATVSDEYWVPSALVLPEGNISASASKNASTNIPTRQTNKSKKGRFSRRRESPRSPLSRGVPIVMGVVASFVVQSQLSEPMGSIQDHIGGSLALNIVNSPWLQVSLAGVTWYLIGLSLVGMVEAFRRK